MSIKSAQKSDFYVVKEITHTTIDEIYPHYYPIGAVAFFLSIKAKGVRKRIVGICRIRNCQTLS